ncbi:MAG: putative cytokinetic ring protein SteA [Desulfocucumaceae bacterium]
MGGVFIYIRGQVKVDAITKVLVKRLLPGDIAVINHKELDELAAEALLEARVRAVINASPSVSERYPNGGPLSLVSSGIVLIDNVGKDIMSLADGETIEILGEKIFYNKKIIATGVLLNTDLIKEKMEYLKNNMHGLLEDFIKNTFDYAKKEMDLINNVYKMPELKTTINGKQVLIVVRGKHYKEDLRAIRTYIDEIKPVLIGVDGGADALRERGYIPDLIVGDMDSVSDEALICGAELVSHAYRDGNSPGLDRINKMGIASEVFVAPGTSEDIAMLLAHEKGAELIVLVGSHSNIHDFLEKGRKGMASTFLVRLKIGSKLVDAKGVSKLYRSKFRARELVKIVVAAIIPAIMVIILSPPIIEIIKLLYLQFKLYISMGYL